MTDKIFTSNKKHLIFLGFEIAAIGISILILVNFRIFTVKEITHYNWIASLLLALGALTLVTGFRKRSFIFGSDSLSFVNKTVKFKIDYSNIYHVRLFKTDSTRQFTLGIVSESDKEVFSISSAFFEAKVLLDVAKEFISLSGKYEFLIEDEIGLLHLDSETKINSENEQ